MIDDLLTRIGRVAAATAIVAAALLTGPAPDTTASSALPARILDTRDGTGTPARAPGRVLPGTTLRVETPATRGSGSLVLNLTATDALAPGYVSAWPCDQRAPDTSVLNVAPGRSTPNTVLLGRSSGGVCLRTSAPMHLVADLMATYAPGEGYAAAPPQRVLDTRTAGAPLGAGETRRLQVGPTGGSPVVLNLTTTRTAGPGFVSAAPCSELTGGRTPTTSALNTPGDEDVAATVVVSAPGGEICLYTSVRTDLVVDRFGAGAPGEIATLTPTRLLDTRTGGPGVAHETTRRVRIAGHGGVPDQAATITATVTAIAGPSVPVGHVTVWSCEGPAPTTSLLNLHAGAVRANTAVVRLSASGDLCLRPWTLDGSSVHLLVDVTAWSGTTDRTIAPTRFETLPPGSPLPSGDWCAQRVRPAPEVRPVNTPFNTVRGTAPNGRYPRVDGDFTGTTDEIIQWAACKWGIDEDVVRAQIVKESWWRQTNVGDNGESFGLGQVRVPYHQEAFAHDDARRSSAYNLDYTYASWRSCYEGEIDWLNQFERGSDYAAGDMWGCLGVWFSGRWYVPSVFVYLDGGPTDGYGDLGVRQHLERRTWEHPDFLNG